MRRFAGVIDQTIARLAADANLFHHPGHLLRHRHRLLALEDPLRHREELLLLALDVHLHQLAQHLDLGLEGRIVGREIDQVGEDALAAEVLLGGLQQHVLRLALLQRRVEDLLLDVEVDGERGDQLAEHALALILTLNRKIHRAHARVREGNFELEGLLGFDLHRRTAGVIGTGAIGLAAARILQGFGCRLLGADPYPSPAFPGTYVPLATLLAEADIVTLHCPLTPETRHLIDAAAIAAMKPGVMLINTSRGALVDTAAAIEGLKSGRIGALGLDVYEEEQDLFFRDLSNEVIQDDVFARLLTFNNVVITGHQGFFTADALAEIAATTLANIQGFARDGKPLHPVPL